MGRKRINAAAPLSNAEKQARCRQRYNAMKVAAGQGAGNIAAIAAGKHKTDMQRKITLVFDSMRGLVLEKNRRYGDAALSPKRVFSRLDAGEGIKVRIDDKISRIMNNGGAIRKNDVADLMGYLALLSVSQGWLGFSDLVD